MLATATRMPLKVFHRNWSNAGKTGNGYNSKEDDEWKGRRVMNSMSSSGCAINGDGDYLHMRAREEGDQFLECAIDGDYLNER